MKKRDLFRLHQGLSNVSYFSGVKFAYTIVKNKKLIEEEVELLNDVIKPTDEFNAYEQERVELCERYSERDDSGEVVVQNNNYKIADQKKFDAAMGKLKKKHEDAVNYRIKQVDEYNKLLEEEVDLKLVKLTPDDLPDGMTAEQIEMIIEIID